MKIDRHFEYFHPGVTGHCAKEISLCSVKTLSTLCKENFYKLYSDLNSSLSFSSQRGKRMSFDAIFGSIVAFLEILTYWTWCNYMQVNRFDAYLPAWLKVNIVLSFSLNKNELSRVTLVSRDLKLASVENSFWKCLNDFVEWVTRTDIVCWRQSPRSACCGRTGDEAGAPDRTFR